MTIRSYDARDYFYNLHDVLVNQKYYDTLPYSFHLDMVYKQYVWFKDLIPNHIIGHDSIVIGVFGHDSIEDGRLTYSNIKEKFGEEVAEIIYLCTEDKGRTRDDRKSDKFYEELKTNKKAVFVKMCDLIANVKFAFLTNSPMFLKYKKEYTSKVKPHLYSEQYKPMFDYLEQILNIK